MRSLLFFATVTLLGLALGLNSPSASAHATLVESMPAANAVLAISPLEVRLWFTEPVDIKFSRVSVTDAEGIRYDNNDIHSHGDPAVLGLTLKLDMPPGTYTVIWNVLSTVDGHRTAGTFAFSVGEATSAPSQSTVSLGGSTETAGGPPRWLTGFNRWINFTAMAALLGIAGFAIFVLPAGLLAVKPQNERGPSTAERAALTIRGSIVGSLILLAVGTYLGFWLQAWASSGSVWSWSTIRDVLDGTRYGDIWLLRLGLLFGSIIAALVCLYNLRTSQKNESLRFNGPPWLFLAALAIAIPVTTSLNSHAAASEDAADILTFVDWLHMVASGLWIGGLIQFVAILPVVIAASGQRVQFLAHVIPRFSLLATVCVIAIITTGAVQWWQQLGGVGEVVESNYGYILLAKVLLLLPLLALGAFNLLIARPRFLALARERLVAALSSSWERRFRLTVTSEVVLGITILAIAAALSDTSPPNDASSRTAADSTSSQSTVQQAQADDLAITLVLEPGFVGRNDVGIFLTDTDGDPRPIQNVLVRFKYLDQSLGVTEDEAQPLHPPQHYVLATSQLSLAGQWEVELIVRRQGLFDARTRFVLSIQS